MNSNIKRKRPKYPFRTSAVYTSVILSVLSVLLAILLLSEEPWLLPYYLISSVFITAIVFSAKNYILSVRESKQYKDDMVQTKEEEEGGTRWGLLLATFFGLLLLIAIPLVLANFLDPVAWIILLVSFTTGVSFAEVVLYLYLRGTLTNIRRITGSNIQSPK